MATSDDDAISELKASAVAPPSAAPTAGDGDGDDPAIADLHSSAVLPGQEPPDAPPPPTRALGPPRLHSQTRLPRPPPTPTLGAPVGARGPAPPPPPEDLSAPAVIKGAAQNFIPSALGAIQGTMESLEPKNLPSTIGALNQLGVGALSYAGLYGGTPQVKAQDRAALNATGQVLHDRWLTKKGFLTTLKHDPAQLGMDVAAPLSLMAGGEGLAAEVPGLAGTALRTVARAADVGEAAVNPLGYPFRALSAVTRAPGAIARATTAARGGAGAFKAAQSGIDPAEAMADDAGQAAMRSTFRSRGLNGPAANESVLRAIDPDRPISNQTVTGNAANPEQAEAVGANINDWRQDIGRQAAQLTGAEGPHPTALGDHLEQAQIASHNAAIDNYDQMRAMPGEFDPSFAPGLHGAVESAFAKAGLPPITGPGSLDTLPKTYGKTLEAMNAMHDQIADLASHDELNANNLMNVRQEIGGYFKGASGSDIKGLRTLQEALDNHIASSAEAGDFAGGDGAQVAAGMRKAIDGYRQHINTFEEGPAAKAVQGLRSAQTSDPTGRLTPAAPGTTEAVTSQLGKQLINQGNLSVPGGANQLHSHLTTLMGGPETAGAKALNDYVRQSVTKLDPQGNLAAKPGQIHRFMDSPMSRSVFPTEERPHMLRLAEGDRLMQAKPTKGTQTAGLLTSLRRGLIQHGTGAVIGGVLGKGLGPVGEYLGARVGEHISEQAFRAARARGAFRKALRAPRAIGPVARFGPRAALAAGQAWAVTPQTPEEQQREAEKNDQDIVAAAPPVGEVAKAANMGKAPPATPTDIDTVVRMAAAEGDPTPEGWKAVAAVMRNRSLEGGHSLSDLAAEPKQFEAYGNRNYAALQPGSPQYQRILAAIAPVMAGKEDPTGGADSYYAPDLQRRLGRKPPSWDDGSGQMLGTQRFFKNKYRRAHAAGGRVIDMTEHLMRRAEQAQKAAQASTKPLLALSDDTVARALRVAQRGI
jgi:hypothetical protein